MRLYDGSGVTPDTCTGTLIRPDWLITARHCLEIEELAIALRLDGETRVLEARERASHSELDVGLIRVEPALAEDDAVRPLALAATTLDERWLGERVELAGFGIDEQGLLSTEPRYAVEAITEIRDAKIAVDGLGRSGGCLGDSGGPLLMRDDRGRPAVCGILSTGSATCLHRDTYVRIDLVADWIETIAGAEDSEPAACGRDRRNGICYFGNALVCRDGLLDVTACEGATVCGWDTARAGFGCVPATDDPCAGVGPPASARRASLAMSGRRRLRTGLRALRPLSVDAATGVPRVTRSNLR